MKNKKKRLFKILFFPISLILCLSIFIISSFASEGYELDYNTDIISYNLADLNKLNTLNSIKSYSYSIDNQILKLDNTNSSDDDPYIYFNNFITLQPNTTYSMYCITNNDFQYGGLTGYPYSTSLVYAIGTNKSTFTTNSNQLTFGLCIEGLTGLSYEIKIMIYEGSSDLDYFPYGSYSSISSNPFAPNNIRLIDFLGYGGSGNWTQLPKENAYQYFSIQSFQVERFLNVNNIDEYNSNYGRTGIEIDLYNPIDISGYHYLFNFYTDSYNGTPPEDFYIGFSRYNSTDNYIVYYTQQDSTHFQNSFTIDLPNDFLCDSISVFWYNTDQNRNMLKQITLGGYELGYDNGVKQGRHLGYQSGYDDGYSVGDASGYQRGYNQGTQTNLETNGLKTLFNSILSFPVDMIKSVFNFEFMGVNIASVITFIISIGIVAFVLKKFL